MKAKKILKYIVYSAFPILFIVLSIIEDFYGFLLFTGCIISIMLFILFLDWLDDDE